MADPFLHIKDTYYFEVPKFVWRSRRETREEFPEFWVRLDTDYLLWEAPHVYQALSEVAPNPALLPDWEPLQAEYIAYKEASPANLGKPFLRFLEERYNTVSPVEPGETADPGTWYDALQGTTHAEHRQFYQRLDEAVARREATVEAYIAATPDWAEAKYKAYNKQLSGKVLIPQPLGVQRNMYEMESGFGISKFMIIQLVIAALLLLVFTRLAKRLRDGGLPGNKFFSLLETFLVYLRDAVARPAIGGREADKFAPYLWSIFFFVLTCNLFGMLPWLGAPTGAFGVTSALAVCTLGMVVVSGSIKFGPVGVWKNQVPGMDLPLAIAILIKPVIWVIEVLGMLIRHGVLAVRLLATMVAGHLVLLGIMALAFSYEGAASTAWPITAVISIIAATLFSLLELFVAFLQAYIFTFLSALFIGAAVHHH